ncbi:hypothetical protein GBF38_001425, partial [Nibea albiflora]
RPVPWSAFTPRGASLAGDPCTNSTFPHSFIPLNPPSSSSSSSSSSFSSSPSLSVRHRLSILSVCFLLIGSRGCRYRSEVRPGPAEEGGR